MEKVSKATECFTSGYLCSQSVLGVFCEELGLDRETALKLSLAFGGGFARCGESCGAVTGALMVIGLKEGTAAGGETPQKQTTYRMSNDFIGRFKEHHGSILCRELLACDISRPEEYRRAREEERFQTICPKLVADAVAILETLLAQPHPKA